MYYFSSDINLTVREHHCVTVASKWTDEVKLNLQTCFDCLDWSVFEAAATDLDDPTDTETSHISLCSFFLITVSTVDTGFWDLPGCEVGLQH